MAALFPEGRELTQALVALAALDLALAGELDAETALAASDRGARGAARTRRPPARFGVAGGGVFLQGWTLQVYQRRAALTGAERDAARAADGARLLAATLRAGLDDGAPFLESYPGRRWPVDTVVAVSALARTGADDALVARWVEAAGARSTRPRACCRTRSTPRCARSTGRAGPPACWSRRSGRTSTRAVAAARWSAAVDAFVVRRAGLVGVRERPAGVAAGCSATSTRDPLVAGVSLSASAVALAGARRHGDDVLAAVVAARGRVGRGAGAAGRARAATPPGCCRSPTRSSCGPAPSPATWPGARRSPGRRRRAPWCGRGRRPACSCRCCWAGRRSGWPAAVAPTGRDAASRRPGRLSAASRRPTPRPRSTDSEGTVSRLANTYTEKGRRGPCTPPPEAPARPGAAALPLRGRVCSVPRAPLVDVRGCSSMVELQLSKLIVRVRFPSPAPR